MPSGRADYWYGMLPGMPGLGVSQGIWKGKGTATIDPAATVTVLTYTVPAGYLLYVASGMITCNYPGINVFKVRVNITIFTEGDFDTTVTLPFNPSGAFILQAGDILTVTCTNNDSIRVYFRVSFLGFTEYKID